jgi:hypothetical protein
MAMSELSGTRRLDILLPSLVMASLAARQHLFDVDFEMAALVEA